jgi:alkylhydroperoxidase family enzyme
MTDTPTDPEGPPRISPIAPDTRLPGLPPGRPGHNDGRPLNVFLTLGHHPSLLQAFTRFGNVLLNHGSLPDRERELVILRVGWRGRSPYEFGQHTLLGRAAGVDDDEIRRLTEPGLDGWPDADAALLAMVDELCADDRVGDATWAALAERWSEAELLELLVLAGYYRLVCGLLNSAGVRLEPDTPGWPAAEGGS